MVANTWKVFHTTTTDKDDGVLLEVVTFSADVGDDFVAVGEANFGNLTESGVRLLWRAGVNLETNAAALWAVVQSRRLRLGDCFFTTFADELVNGGHNAIVLGWRLSGFISEDFFEKERFGKCFAGNQPGVAGNSASFLARAIFPVAPDSVFRFEGAETLDSLGDGKASPDLGAATLGIKIDLARGFSEIL